MRLPALVASVLLPAAFLTSCESLDDDRIPPMPVNIVFQSVGMWESYGVPGATDYRRFILQKKLPAGFPYTALSYTGFGGVLLVADILGDPQAFDLSCPVEARQDIIVNIDRETNLARCPECGSEYDVFSNYGTPVSGPAVTRHYALTRYHVNRGSTALEYIVVTR
ncbi:MAG: hypothetical protein HDS92_04490 [Bacteroidales bacterium]|nr:hypothetical protein [Bacteroidales bacterium]